jgi:spore germination protein GerM
MTRARPCWHILSFVVLAALAVAACGLDRQDEPEILAADNVPDGLLDSDAPTTTIPPPAAETSAVTVYFLRIQGDNATLVAVERDVSDPGSARQRVDALLQQPPTRAEGREGLTTAIPTDTVLNNVRVATGRGVATVDLSEEFLDVQGIGQRAAYAQIVWTMARVPGVERVQFRVDGEDIAALVGDGSTRDGPVGPAAYVSLEPSPGDA